MKSVMIWLTIFLIPWALSIFQKLKFFYSKFCQIWDLISIGFASNAVQVIFIWACLLLRWLSSEGFILSKFLCLQIEKETLFWPQEERTRSNLLAEWGRSSSKDDSLFSINAIYVPLDRSCVRHRFAFRPQPGRSCRKEVQTC